MTTSPDRWGDYATWAGAGVSFLALVAAAVAAWVTWRGLRLERDRQLRADAEHKARHASKICAWIGKSDAHLATGGWAAYVRNLAEVPIYRARLGFFMGSGDSFGSVVSVPIWLLPPGETKLIEIHEYVWSKLAASPLDPDQADLWIRVDLRFRTPDGARWHRDTEGELREVDRTERSD